MSFLSESQRLQLDAALAAKEKEQAAARAHLNRIAAGERKSRQGIKGKGGPAKGGTGGKFTWGSVFTRGDQAESVLDKNDPNYDSEEERNVVMQTQQSRLKSAIQDYKLEVQGIVEEYFESGDVQDVAESLDDLGASELMHYFVKRLLTLALDRKGREREMASMLLSNLYAEVIPPEQVQKGFLALVDSLPDLVLDVPDAADLLALFTVRAIVDDVLPPAFVQRIPTEPEEVASLRHKAEAQLSSRHTAEKVLRCWGAGAGMTHQDTKDSISRIIDEFAASLDAAEASRCLRALAVPFFHHEFVKQALQRAMASVGQPLSQALVNLLARLSSTNEITASQLAKGFQRVASTLDDLALDSPGAQEQWATVLKMCQPSVLPDGAAVEGLQRTGGSAASSLANGGGGYAHSISAFKTASGAAIREYFASSDAQEVGRRLQELDEPGLLHLFVKQALALALDRRARERELVSSLLTALCPQVISTDQVAMGFTRLLGAADDLVLDCPDAVHLVSLFLGRAIVDEVLPPSFLTQVLPALRAESLGIAVVKSVGSMLSARHGAERLTNCWSGGVQTLEQIREQIKSALQEYLSAGDAAETSRLLTELGVPLFRHEVVVGALELAFSRDDARTADLLLALLAHLSATGVVNQSQMTQGFSRVRARLDEETLDFGPKARDVFSTFVKRATAAGWLVLEPEV